MAGAIPESLIDEGVRVDFAFSEPRPSFGDLYLICGAKHPRFPATGSFGFEQLADLQFDQVDDYFGIRSVTDDGSDVPIWLFPLVDGEVVHHHPGPFDGVRLEYSILRNPLHRAEHFLRCVKEFASLANDVVYRNRELRLGSPPDLAILQSDINAVVLHWAGKGIVVGSNEALAVDF